jgi:hypothetical protein
MIYTKKNITTCSLQDQVMKFVKETVLQEKKKVQEKIQYVSLYQKKTMFQ